MILSLSVSLSVYLSVCLSLTLARTYELSNIREEGYKVEAGVFCASEAS